MICVVASLFLGSSKVSAENSSPYYMYAKSASSKLTISSSVATCESDILGYSETTTEIVINQTLQVKGFLNSWIVVAMWSETDTGHYGSATNTRSNLSSGTYRLISKFTVYSGNNSEEITVCSSEENA